MIKKQELVPFSPPFLGPYANQDFEELDKFVPIFVDELAKYDHNDRLYQALINCFNLKKERNEKYDFNADMIAFLKKDPNSFINEKLDDDLKKNLNFRFIMSIKNNLDPQNNFKYMDPQNGVQNLNTNNFHILNTLNNLFIDGKIDGAAEEMYPNQYSLLQIRFFDYVYNHQTYAKKYNNDPQDTFGTNEKSQTSQAADNKPTAPTIIKNFDTVFDNQQHIPAPVNTANQFYLSHMKMVLKHTVSPTKSALDTTDQKKKETYSKYRAPKNLPTSEDISKNYDYLFESSISKTGQFSILDKSPIIISKDQLECGKPQNAEVKIEVNIFGNNVRLTRKNYGTIDFSGPINNIDIVDISSLVEIEERYVDIDCKLADEYQVGINKEAMVTLENVFPLKKGGNYELSLRKYCEQNEDLKFIHYFPDKNILLFYVKDFRSGPFHFPLCGETSKDFYIKCSEKMDVSITKEGKISNFAVNGRLEVESTKRGQYAISLDLPENLSKLNLRPLNQVDPELFNEEKILEFSNDSEAITIFMHNLLEWKYKSTDANDLPIKFSFNISEDENDQNGKISTFYCEVNVNRANISFQSIVLRINAPNAKDARISSCDGESEIDIKKSQIVWTIIDIDNDNSAQIEFSVPSCEEYNFFPIDVKFRSDSLYSDIIADKIAKGESNQPDDEGFDYDFDKPEKSYEISCNFSSGNIEITNIKLQEATHT